MSTPAYNGERAISKAARANLKATEILWERGLLPEIIDTDNGPATELQQNDTPGIAMDTGGQGE